LGGCGRFFEGDGEQMDKALNQILANLDDNTVILISQNQGIYIRTETDKQYFENSGRLLWSRI